MKTCTSCGRAAPDQAVSCPGCGKPMAAVGAAPPAPPPPPPRKRPPPPGPVRGPLVSSPVGAAPNASNPSGQAANPAADWRVWVAGALLLGLVFLVWKLSPSPQTTGTDGQAASQATVDAPKGETKDGSSTANTGTSLSVATEGKEIDGKLPAPAEGEKKAKTPGSRDPVTGKPSSPRRTATFSLYELRTDPDRGKKLTLLGGTEESENTVAAGLEWLARHQAEEGHWGPDCLRLGPQGRCAVGGPCQNPGGPDEMALSGLALLAFQAGGHYSFNHAKHSDNVKKGLDWMVAHQRDDGALVGSTSRGSLGTHFMYEHGIATFALAEACAVAKSTGRHADEAYLAAAEKAIRFIEQHQHNDGGWRYTTAKSEGGDASVSGWPMLALKSAKNAGIAVDEQCIEKTKRFFAGCEIHDRGRTHYQPGSQISEATTGVGMLVHHFLLQQSDSPLVREAAPYLADYAERTWGKDRHQRRGEADFYLWYNCTLAMQQAGGEPWNRWNAVVRDRIVDLQKREGCPRGSWDPTDRWGHTGGRIYSTALAVLTLEVYYRFAKDTDVLTTKKQ